MHKRTRSSFMLTVNIPAKEDTQHLLTNVVGQALPSR